MILTIKVPLKLLASYLRAKSSSRQGQYPRQENRFTKIRTTIGKSSTFQLWNGCNDIILPPAGSYQRAYRHGYQANQSSQWLYIVSHVRQLLNWD